MLEYTKTVLNQTIDDIKKLGTVINFSTQSIYIAYLIYAISAPVGILYVNTPLLVVSLAYLVFSIVMERKKQKKTDGKIKSKVKDAYKIAKSVILLPVLINAIITLITLKNDNVTFSLLFTILMIFSYVMTILITVITKIVEHRFAMFMVAIKADFEPIANAYNNIRKFKGERVAEPEEDKAEQKIRADLDTKVKKIKEESPEKAPAPEMLSKEELKAVRKEMIQSVASNMAEKAKQKFKSLKGKLSDLIASSTNKSQDAIALPKPDGQPNESQKDEHEAIKK
jgi:hypothetical protein